MIEDIDTLKKHLEILVDRYNRKDFIANDPISIPHSFEKKQDKEIMGLMAAVFAWGQRKTIINKSRELAERMGGEPYKFITEHKQTDLKALLGFKHRTFNDEDLLYFVDFFRRHYNEYESLEDAFLLDGKFTSMKDSLIHFNEYFTASENFPKRTQKHIATPKKGSACKRINMFLRWMVRKDNCGVDFGIWHRIPMSELIIPIDVHVDRTSKLIGLMTKDTKVDWNAAEELTQALKLLDKDDPVRYDFALFSISEAGLLSTISELHK